MSDDIAMWLREWADIDLGESFQGNREASLGYMAAAEIERLRAELVATRAAKEAEWERCAKYLDRAERAEAERDAFLALLREAGDALREIHERKRHPHLALSIIARIDAARK